MRNVVSIWTDLGKNNGTINSIKMGYNDIDLLYLAKYVKLRFILIKGEFIYGQVGSINIAKGDFNR